MTELATVDSVEILVLVPARRDREPGDLHEVRAVLERLEQLRELLLEERVDQGLLVGEATVDGADSDAGVVRDVVEGDAEATLREELARRLEDPLPVPLRILP